MDLGIEGRRAAVAAASAGLGLGCARALVREGVDVAICGREAERVDAAVAGLQADARSGAAVTGVVADVSTVAGATGFVTDAAAALGGVDILVTNA
ncbi:MAG TPA: SDR family NAD(P)-dependent oxidoreductase, partial [Acidimicrobiales bacterium]|nr:SDR family NAD(P)-dependent oxidoreductase [Acidimicrobiales bacterium]